MTLSTAFSILRICANFSPDQAQSAGMLAKFPFQRFNTAMPESPPQPYPPPICRPLRLLAHLLRRCASRDHHHAHRQPTYTDPWEWICGFYPGSRPGEIQSDTSATFEDARAEFASAWKIFFANRTDADFQAWRYQWDLTACIRCGIAVSNCRRNGQAADQMLLWR
jgi:hypothetical protein